MITDQPQYLWSLTVMEEKISTEAQGMINMSRWHCEPISDLNGTRSNAVGVLVLYPESVCSL